MATDQQGDADPREHGQFDQFSSTVKTRLEALLPASDCCLLGSDGAKYPVHKVQLMEQSTVLRHAFDWKRNTEACDAVVQLRAGVALRWPLQILPCD